MYERWNIARTSKKTANTQRLQSWGFQTPVQLLARLLRSDNKGMLRLVDTGKPVHYKKSQGGHYFSKHNHPNLAFEIMNIRPISAISNKLQWDQPWYYWKENLLAIIGEDQYNILEAMSKEPKGELRKKTTT